MGLQMYMKKAQASEEEEEEDSFGFSTPLVSHTPSFATRKATPLWATQDKPDGKPDGYDEPESETHNEALKTRQEMDDNGPDERK